MGQSRRRIYANGVKLTEILQLMRDALPYALLLLTFAGFWRLGNMSISLQWSAKTYEPQRDQRAAKLKMERDEARRIAEEVRHG
jgi:hypothetical protein